MLNIQSLCALATTTAVCTLSSAIASTPELPGYKIVPSLSDEFNGDELDVTKWSTNEKVVGWNGRIPGLFDPANVIVSDGSLQLWARAAKRNASWPAGYDNYTTSAVHSLTRIKQGYFEIRWRSGSSGISSSWWFHQNNGTTWTEIDVFETTGVNNSKADQNDLLPSHVHVFELPNTPLQDLPKKCGCKIGSVPPKPPCSKPAYYRLPQGETFAGAFHTAALNWTETQVTVAINGVVVNTITSPCLVEEIGMDFDRETMPGWMAMPDPATLPDQPFEIDYIRSYQLL